MQFSKESMQKAQKTIRFRREQAKIDAEKRVEEIKKKVPRIHEIDLELQAIGSSIGRYVIECPDRIEEKLCELRDKSFELRNEQDELLRKIGLTYDYFDPVFSCSDCKDTGFIDGKKCSCLKELLRIEAANSLNALSSLSLCEFGNFSLGYYPDTLLEKSAVSAKFIMSSNFEFCKQYANDFHKSSQSILMLGNTGLGKTHLSLSIAKELIEKDFSVLYGSTQSLILKIEKEHFGRSDTGSDTISALLDCDLLILDDLGTEFSTNFTTSAIYNIINSRQLSSKPTIISTNLSIAELEEKYSDRIVSRIVGSSRILQFYGNDIRLLKLTKREY